MQCANVFMHKGIVTSLVARNLQALCRQSTGIECRRLRVELQAQDQLGYLIVTLTRTAQCAPGLWKMLDFGSNHQPLPLQVQLLASASGGEEAALALFVNKKALDGGIVRIAVKSDAA